MGGSLLAKTVSRLKLSECNCLFASKLAPTGWGSAWNLSRSAKRVEVSLLTKAIFQPLEI